MRVPGNADWYQMIKKFWCSEILVFSSSPPFFFLLIEIKYHECSLAVETSFSWNCFLWDCLD